MHKFLEQKARQLNSSRIARSSDEALYIKLTAGLEGRVDSATNEKDRARAERDLAEFKKLFRQR